MQRNALTTEQCAHGNKRGDELQQNRRGESRSGFPVPVLLAIEDLAEEHDHAFPGLARIETDFWNLSKAR